MQEAMQCCSYITCSINSDHVHPDACYISCLYIFVHNVFVKCALTSFVFSVPDDLKVNPGPVETIAQHPSKREKVRHVGIPLHDNSLLETDIIPKQTMRLSTVLIIHLHCIYEL